MTNMTNLAFRANFMQIVPVAVAGNNSPQDSIIKLPLSDPLH